LPLRQEFDLTTGRPVLGGRDIEVTDERSASRGLLDRGERRPGDGAARNTPVAV
jgi:hypothetical protein